MAQLQVLSEEKRELLLEKFQEDNVLAKKLVKKLTSFLGSYDLDNRRGYTFERDGVTVEFVILSSVDNKIQVTYTNADEEEKVTGSVVVETNGKFVLKGYEVIENEVVKTREMEVTEEFLTPSTEENLELPETREEVKESAPCIYGNWCGPGCSGPGAPISPVDSCCKSHDNCYGSVGYFACSCDRKLQDCLWPYTQQGSEWAIAVSAWFDLQWCNPFK